MSMLGNMFQTPDEVRQAQSAEITDTLKSNPALGRGMLVGSGIARAMGFKTAEESRAEETMEKMSDIKAPEGSPEYYYELSEALKGIDPNASMQLMELGREKEVERQRLDFEKTRVDLEGQRVTNQVEQFNAQMAYNQNRAAIQDEQWQRVFDQRNSQWEAEQAFRVQQFNTGVSQWERTFDNDRYEFILGHNYKVSRDSVADKQWRDSFEEGKDQFRQTQGLAVDRFKLSKSQWEEMAPHRQAELANAELGLQATELELAGAIYDQNRLFAYNNVVKEIPFNPDAKNPLADYSKRVGVELVKKGLTEQGNNWLKQAAEAERGALGTTHAPKYNQVEGTKDGVNGTYLYENGQEIRFIPARAGTDTIEYSSAVEKSIERDSTAAQDANVRAQTARGTAALIENSDNFNGGLPTYLEDQLKKYVGGRDIKSVMITELTRLRNSAAIQNLPKGPASDKDIALVLSGEIPAEFAGKEEALRYARGIAKLAQVEADFYTDRSNWQSMNGNLAGFDAFTRYNADQKTLMGVNQDAMLMFWEGYHGGDPTIEQEFMDKYGFSPAKLQERMSADAKVFEGRKIPR